ncbi:hypothetical protein PQ465_00300 [Sphingobacterium oryzagri]|uniref:Uncharacterized protein n=1 Tax=Sphingobacterium oryzagri TaxID=3025669 RepID=A0ABY7WGS9_9SPHI|nr:hypothetical protein [Sphingobacterium sp. KACC 22765]WDF68839.1 hypothetical protein PQ465_00300 [Sphingobacterium sp. KACC 22765]
MKFITSSLMIVMTIFVATSCQKSTTLNPDEKLPIKQNEAAGRPLPVGDINLDPTYDWTESSWTTYFRNSSGFIGTVTTLNPFIDGGQKIFGNVNTTNADMYASQGWTLVSRDFGTPSDANSYPFIMLYNKYRGIVRVCILRTNDVLSSHQEITLSFAQNASYPKLFRYVLGDNITANSVQTAITQAGVNEWMIADFDASNYDTSFDNYSSFVISLREIVESNIELAGEIKLEGTAQVKAASNSGSMDGLKYLVNFFTTATTGLAKVTSTSASSVEQTISSEGVGAVVETIFKLLLGFSGGGSGSTYNLQLRGPLNLEGQITTSSPKTSFSVYLKNLNDVTGYRAVQPINWGVFSLGSVPKVRDQVDFSSTFIPDPNGGPDYSEVTTATYRTVELAPNFITNASLLINPDVSSEVQSIECTTIEQINDIVDANGNILNQMSGTVRTTYETKDLLPLSTFQGSTKILSAKNNSYLAVGIKIAYTNGNVIYKVIPI